MTTFALLMRNSIIASQPKLHLTGTIAGIDQIAALYADFLSKLDFDVEFEVLEVELAGNLGLVRTRSKGTIVPKGQAPKGSEGNREAFVVKKIDGAWKFYRYIFNAEV